MGHLIRCVCQNCGRRFHVPDSLAYDATRTQFCCAKCYNDYCYKIERLKREEQKRVERARRREQLSRVLDKNTNQGVKNLGRSFLPRFKG